ncbi:MAG: lipoprotein [Gammaproteobacteria bacterium]|nr:lipoprotein [Gammaproteobacteria bacterium]
MRVPAVVAGLSLLVLLAVLAGCGQKGDLYLPDRPQDQRYTSQAL